MSNDYDPLRDPGVLELERIVDEEKRRELELGLLAGTDNRPSDEEWLEEIPAAPELPEMAAPGILPVAPQPVQAGRRESLIARAASHDGTHEDPMGSNFVEFNDWYYGRRQKAYWCGTYVSHVCHHAGIPVGPTSRGAAYTPDFARWGKNNGLWVGWDAPIEPGWVVLYYVHSKERIAHCGITSTGGSGSFRAWEGNTDARGGRTGGRVMEQTRSRDSVGRYGGFVNLNPFLAGDPVPLPTPHQPPGDELTRIAELQRLVGSTPDGKWGPKTVAACSRNLVGWEAEVRRRGSRAVLNGNRRPALVRWLQTNLNRKFNIALNVDGNPNGPATNHGIVVGLGQADGICGPTGFREACR